MGNQPILTIRLPIFPLFHTHNTQLALYPGTHFILTWGLVDSLFLTQ